MEDHGHGWRGRRIGNGRIGGSMYGVRARRWRRLCVLLIYYMDTLCREL